MVPFSRRFPAYDIDNAEECIAAVKGRAGPPADLDAVYEIYIEDEIRTDGGRLADRVVQPVPVQQ